jgi:hypothetical protein
LKLHPIRELMFLTLGYVSVHSGLSKFCALAPLDPPMTSSGVKRPDNAYAVRDKTRTTIPAFVS